MDAHAIEGELAALSVAIAALIDSMPPDVRAAYRERLGRLAQRGRDVVADLALSESYFDRYDERVAMFLGSDGQGSG